MSTIQRKRPPLDGYLFIMICLTLSLFAGGMCSSCKATKADGSPTWNTRQLMKTNKILVNTAKGPVPYRSNGKTMVKK